MNEIWIHIIGGILTSIAAACMWWVWGQVKKFRTMLYAQWQISKMLIHAGQRWMEDGKTMTEDVDNALKEIQLALPPRASNAIIRLRHVVQRIRRLTDSTVLVDPLPKVESPVVVASSQETKETAI